MLCHSVLNVQSLSCLSFIQMTCLIVDMDLVLKDNRLVSNAHCFIQRDELFNNVWLHDTRYDIQWDLCLCCWTYSGFSYLSSMIWLLEMVNMFLKYLSNFVHCLFINGDNYFNVCYLEVVFFQLKWNSFKLDIKDFTWCM